MFLFPDKEAISASSAALPSPLPSPLPDRAQYGGVGAEEEEEEDFIDPEQSDRLSFLGCVEAGEADSPGPSPSTADEALKTRKSPCSVGVFVKARDWCIDRQLFCL